MNPRSMLSSFLTTVAGFLMLPALLGVADADSGDALTGNAWSPNTGWISFNCTNGSCNNSDYGVSVGSGSFVRELNGHAWSSNLGWISFNATDLTGCPVGTCSARMNTTNGELYGWAKALSANGSQAGGWGGWIKLRGSTYGVLANGAKWTGYAWGGGPVTGTGESSPYIGGNAETGWISFRGYTAEDVPQLYGVEAAVATNAVGPRSISCGVSVPMAPMNTDVTWSVIVDATKVPGPYTYEWYLPGGNTFNGAVTSSVTAPYYMAGVKKAAVTVTANGIPYVVDCDSAPIAGQPSPWYPQVVIGVVNLDGVDDSITVTPGGTPQAGISSISLGGEINCYDGTVAGIEDCDFPVTTTFDSAFIVDMGLTGDASRNGADFVLPASPPISYIDATMEIPVSHSNWLIPDAACPYTNPTATCTMNIKLCADQSLSPYSANGVVCEGGETNCLGNYDDYNCANTSPTGWYVLTVNKAPPPPPTLGVCKPAPAITKPGKQVTWSVVPGSVLNGVLPFTYVWTAIHPNGGVVPLEDEIVDPIITDTSATKTYSTYGIKKAHVTITDALGRVLERDCSTARMTIFEER
jgi:hypothetical protein